MKKDTALKIIFVSAAALLVLWLVKTILLPTGSDMGYYINGNLTGGYGHMQRGYVYSYSTNGSIVPLLSAVINLLFAVLIIGLIAGAILYIKNNVFTEDDNPATKASFTSKKPAVKEVCSECGKETNPSWKVCPYCGNSVAANTQ